MNTYLIRWKPRTAEHWLPDNLGYDTPTTIAEAAPIYSEAEEHYDGDQVQVLCLNEAAGTFTDATNDVVQYIFDADEQAAVWAAEDRAHVRMESARGVFV